MKSTVKEQPIDEAFEYFGVKAAEIIAQEQVEVEGETNSQRIRREARAWLKQFM